MQPTGKLPQKSIENPAQKPITTKHILVCIQIGLMNLKSNAAPNTLTTAYAHVLRTHYADFDRVSAMTCLVDHVQLPCSVRQSTSDILISAFDMRN